MEEDLQELAKLGAYLPVLTALTRLLCGITTSEKEEGELDTDSTYLFAFANANGNDPKVAAKDRREGAKQEETTERPEQGREREENHKCRGTRIRLTIHTHGEATSAVLLVCGPLDVGDEEEGLHRLRQGQTLFRVGLVDKVILSVKAK